MKSSSKIAGKEISKKIAIAKKSAKNQKIESSKIELKKLNLSSFAKELSEIPLKERKERESLYKYPSDFPMQERNSDKGKRFRNSLRSKRDNLMNSINYNAMILQKENSKENSLALKNAIAKFDEFYQKNYLKNDYSIESISILSDPIKNKSLILALKIIKMQKGLK